MIHWRPLPDTTAPGYPRDHQGPVPGWWHREQDEIDRLAVLCDDLPPWDAALAMFAGRTA